MRKIVITTILCLIIISATNIVSISQVRPKDCDDALQRCLDTYSWFPDMYGIIHFYCYNGWVFCMLFLV